LIKLFRELKADSETTAMSKRKPSPDTSKPAVKGKLPAKSAPKKPAPKKPAGSSYAGYTTAQYNKFKQYREDLFDRNIE
jgi:hypothetical protein